MYDLNTVMNGMSLFTVVLRVIGFALAAPVNVILQGIVLNVGLFMVRWSLFIPNYIGVPYALDSLNDITAPSG